MLGICLAAALAGTWGAGQRDLWLDEGISVALARSGADPFAITLAGSETNMSLYYAALRGWLLLGSSELWIRGLSALFVVAAIPPCCTTWPGGCSTVGLASSLPPCWPPTRWS